MRLILGLVAGFILGLTLVAVAAEPGEGEICVDVPAFGVQICGTTTTTSTSTTSTTVATTTTTAPTTTTSSTLPDQIIPETQWSGPQTVCRDDPQCPGSGFSAEGGYTIMLSRFGVHHWWWAPYHGDTLPYQPDTRWLDGDREGYSCAYGFLERGDEIVGRFTATRIEGAAYAKVNDRDMGEAERYYDGTPFGGDTGEIPDESCVNEAAALSSIDYTDPEVCARPDERPRIVFWDDGDVLEIRDYRNTVLHSDEGKFVWLGVEDNRATVAFCVEEGPAIAFYYDGLGDGIVTGDLP